MENKTKKKSINSLIYLLLAVMLFLVVFISVYTVSSGRRNTLPKETESADTTLTDTPAKPGTTANTKSTETTASPAVLKPADSQKPVTDSPADSKQASVEVRYFVSPVNGVPFKNFETDIPVYSITMNDYRAHTGVDIGAPIGSAVVSCSGGTVARVWNDPVMGQSITIDHGDGIFTTYMNLSPESDFIPVVGSKVSMGQTIGAVGESALIEIAEEPHVHLEMKINGEYVDPMEYLSVDAPENIVDVD